MLRRLNFGNLLPFISLVMIIVIFSLLTHGNIWTIFNLKSILNQTIPLVIGGLGMIFVVSQGSVDISQGSVFALCGTIATMLSNQFGIYILFPSAILIGALVGATNGIIVGRFKVPSLTTTLAMLISIRALVATITHGKEIFASQEIINIDKAMIKLPLFIAAVIIIGYIFEKTKIGYYSRAIGENETVVLFTGIPVNNIKMIGFMLSGIMAGLAGVLTVSRNGGAFPGLGNFFELDVLLALFVGGVLVTGGMPSRIYKLLIGATTIAILKNGLIISGVSGEYTEGARGIILILIVFITSKLSFKEVRGI